MCLFKFRRLAKANSLGNCKDHSEWGFVCICESLFGKNSYKRSVLLSSYKLTDLAHIFVLINIIYFKLFLTVSCLV